MSVHLLIVWPLPIDCHPLLVRDFICQVAEAAFELTIRLRFGECLWDEINGNDRGGTGYQPNRPKRSRLLATVAVVQFFS